MAQDVQTETSGCYTSDYLNQQVWRGYKSLGNWSHLNSPKVVTLTNRYLKGRPTPDSKDYQCLFPSSVLSRTSFPLFGSCFYTTPFPTHPASLDFRRPSYPGIPIPWDSSSRVLVVSRFDLTSIPKTKTFYFRSDPKAEGGCVSWTFLSFLLFLLT